MQGGADYIKALARDIRPWLDKIDKVREVIGNDKLLTGVIKIPTIAVIGIQSSGKSSILESISQIELPKGTGCVTRCPLVLQLRSMPAGQDSDEYFTIRTDHEDEASVEKIFDFSRIADLIKEKSTEMTTGFQKIV